MKDRQKRLWARRSTSFLSCLFFPSARYHLYKNPAVGKDRSGGIPECRYRSGLAGYAGRTAGTLLDTEKAFGRRRMMRWGRGHWIWIYFMAKMWKNRRNFKITASFLWERLFVLVPFAEIMPCFIFKGQDIQSRIRELGGDKEIVKQEITGKGAYPWQTK